MIRTRLTDAFGVLLATSGRRRLRNPSWPVTTCDRVGSRNGGLGHCWPSSPRLVTNHVAPLREVACIRINQAAEAQHPGAVPLHPPDLRRRPPFLPVRPWLDRSSEPTYRSRRPIDLLCPDGQSPARRRYLHLTCQPLPHFLYRFTQPVRIRID